MQPETYTVKLQPRACMNCGRLATELQAKRAKFPIFADGLCYDCFTAHAEAVQVIELYWCWNHRTGKYEARVPPLPPVEGAEKS